MTNKSFNNLSEKERLEALQRLQIIRPYLENKTTQTQIAKEQAVTTRTIRHWVKQYRSEGLIGLVRKTRADKGERKVSQELQQLVEGLALKKPALSIASIHRKVKKVAAQLKEPCPSYTSVYEIVTQLEPSLVTLAHEGTSEYKNKFDLIHRTEADKPNAIWQVDHTLFDVLILDNKGRPKKPWLTIILDDYSRAIAGYALSFSAPSALQTALALRHAILYKPQAGWEVCGIPEILYTDHGSDFTSHHIEQVAANLKTQLIFSAVGQPRGRGKVERIFRSISQILLPELPGYQPPETKAKAVLTLSQLATELENYIIHDYHLKPHSSTGVAPQARWTAGGFLPHMPESTSELDLLLLTVAKPRIVHSDGIKFSGFRYIHTTLAGYIREEVLIRYDPRDVAEIFVFHKDNFICRAICTELAGETVSLSEIVTARKRQQRMLREKIQDRSRTVDALLDLRTNKLVETEGEPKPSEPLPKATSKLKRYRNE